MIIFYGVRQYGRIEEHAGSSIATQFAHLWFVPLFPIRSHLVLGDPGGGKFSGIPIPLSGRSVAAGYLRIWGPILTLFCGIGALDALASASTGRFDWVGAFLFYGFVAMSALVGTVTGLPRIGVVEFLVNTQPLTALPNAAGLSRAQPVSRDDYQSLLPPPPPEALEDTS